MTATRVRATAAIPRRAATTVRTGRRATTATPARRAIPAVPSRVAGTRPTVPPVTTTTPARRAMGAAAGPAWVARHSTATTGTAVRTTVATHRAGAPIRTILPP